MIVRTILPIGLEAIFCGDCPEDRSVSAFVHDFIRYGNINTSDGLLECDAGSRDIQANIQANRDYHYPRLKRTICDLNLEGKTVVLMAPGPSLAETFGDEGASKWAKDVDHDSIVYVGINFAAGLVPCDVVFISERSAKFEWLISQQTGWLAPWIPSAPLVTAPEASKFLADVWPDDKRFYFHMPFASIVEDPRSTFLKEKGAALFSFWHSSVMALHFAIRCGAEKVVLVGHDYSMNKEMEIYPGVPAKSHPNRYDSAPIHAIGHDGNRCVMNPTLCYYGKIMEACCYWAERNGTPVLNATPSGLLRWRCTPILEALTKDHEPIVDYLSGEFTDEPNRIDRALSGKTGRYPRSPEAPIHEEVAGQELSAAVTSP